MYKREKLGISVMLLVFVVFIFLANGVNEKCRSYPQVVSIIGALVSAAYIGTILYKEKHQIPLDQSKPLTKEQVLSVITAVALTVVYILLIRTVGYCVTTFLYVAGFSFWHTRTQKKWQYFAVAAGMTVFLYIAFGIFLKIPLPKGFLI